MALLGACSDPPDPAPAPAPTGIPKWSTARHVLWTGPEDPITRPLALMVDIPGGPLDQIAADPDVTTFLNDQFHPWFVLPSKVQNISEGQALFLTAEGCLLGDPVMPTSAGEWIESANSAQLLNQRAETGRSLEIRPEWDFSLPEDHALYGTCKR
jgi:hypothetical protein